MGQAKDVDCPVANYLKMLVTTKYAGFGMFFLYEGRKF